MGAPGIYFEYLNPRHSANDRLIGGLGYKSDVKIRVVSPQGQ
jgi:hypothetical protein